MTRPATHIFRLLKWGRTLARHGALRGIENDPNTPQAVKRLTRIARFGTAQPLRLPAERFEMGRRPFVCRDVLRQPLADARAQHLDGDLPPLAGHRAVDLRDRRRADRHRVDLRVDVGHRPFEAAGDLRLDRREGHRRQAVLQRQQVARRLLADEVGPGGERLAELDRRRADVLERGGVVGHTRRHVKRPDDPRE